MRNVIVIGAGAAGMMAACRASECGARVLLLDKNEKAGKKSISPEKGAVISQMRVIRRNCSRTWCTMQSFFTVHFTAFPIS